MGAATLVPHKPRVAAVLARALRVATKKATGGYCTFELNRCTRNRAAYISTFRYANLMFLDCVNSFGEYSSWSNHWTVDSTIATP